MDCYKPAYVKLQEKGQLKKKVEMMWELFRECRLCPRECALNRLERKGACQVGGELIISSWGPHIGEERPLVGYTGSGTIFFSGCNLECVFCQNYDISQEVRGRKTDTDTLKRIMLTLQEHGTPNINLVSPTHVLPWIVEAVHMATEEGLNIPLVYNSGGYDSIEALKILDGIIDIYMPDFKYGSNELGEKYSGIPDYWDMARKAVKEMHRQVGDLIITRQGIAIRGLLIRHLLLPGQARDTEKIFRFLAEKISRDTYLNIMAQYYPSYKSHSYPELKNRIGIIEYRQVVKIAESLGLYRFD